MTTEELKLYIKEQIGDKIEEESISPIIVQDVLDAVVDYANLKAPSESPLFTGTVYGITKSMIGLGNADNTSDLNKPLSTAQTNALAFKEPRIIDGSSSQYIKGDKTLGTLNKSAVGLGSVDNTTDLLKPISTATQSALDLKVNSTLVGASNGIATLDAGGKVPFAQLPSSLLIYKGTWNVLTNTPALSDGSGTSGDVYRVTGSSTPVNFDFGSGNIEFASGDYVLYNGTIWEKSDGTDAVTSVNGKQGVITLYTDDISEDGSPVNLWYTDARVKVYGDTQWVPIGGNYITTNSNQTGLTGTKALSNTWTWTQAIGTTNSILINNSSVGEGIKVSNLSSGTGGFFINSNTGIGIALTNSSTGIGLSGTNSSSGRLFNLTNTSSGRLIYLNNNSTGYAMQMVNTSSGHLFNVSNNGEDGKAIYLNNSGLNTVGVYSSVTNIGKAFEAYHAIGTAFKVSTGAGDGKVFHITADLALSTGDLLAYYRDATLTTHINYLGTLTTPIVKVTDDAYAAGWNGSLEVPTKNAIYDKIESMSSVDPNDYITLSSLSATSPVFYDSITGEISMQVASDSQDGYLTSTDWNIFNGKIDGSGTVYYIPYFDGTKSIANSPMITDGTSVGFGKTPLGSSGYSIEALYGIDTRGDITAAGYLDAGSFVQGNEIRSLNLSSNYGSIKSTNLTVNRLFELPDKSGTFAMLDDIVYLSPAATQTGYIDIDGSITATGATFNINSDTESDILIIKNSYNGNEALTGVKIESNAGSLRFLVYSTIYDGGYTGDQSAIVSTNKLSLAGGNVPISLGGSGIEITGGSSTFNGDIEITATTKGIILTDTVLGTRHRVVLTSGVLTVGSAL